LQNTYKIKNKYKAVTLIETLLYIALTSIMLYTITISFNDFLRTKVRTSVRTEANTQAVFIIEKINYELRNADSIITPTNGTSDTKITYHTIGAVNNSTLDIVNGNLQITNGSNTKVLSNNLVNISNLNLENRAPVGTQPIIYYSFTITTSGGSIDFNYSNNYQSSVLLKLYP